jgi:signal transduction histidine kinase
MALGAARWLLGQELADDARRDDLLSVTQHTGLLVSHAADAAGSYVLTGSVEERRRVFSALREASETAHALESWEVEDDERHEIDAVTRMVDGNLDDASSIFAAQPIDMDRYDRLDESLDRTEAELDALKGAVRRSDARHAQRAKLRADILFVVVGVLSLAVAAAVGFSLGRRLTRPLEALRRAVLAFEPDGAGGPLVLPRTDDEVGDLGLAFGAMARRVRDERALISAARAELADVFASVGEAIVVVDDLGRIVKVNAAAAALSERQDLMDIRVEDVFPDLGGAALAHGETTLRTATNDIPVRVAVSGLRAGSGRVICAQDRRAQLAIEKELRDARSLEEIGRLAAGVTHEINSPLQYVGDSLSFLDDAGRSLLEALARYRAVPPADAPEHAQAFAAATRLAEQHEVDALLPEIGPAIERALEGVNRVGTIVLAMRDFAHPARSTLADTDVNRLVASALAIARHEYKYVADVTTKLKPIPAVPCMAGELGQAVLNLVVNAAHAVADTGRRGEIVVGTRVAGDRVVISVSDTGTGIPESARPHIFAAFFTTKERGRGTGQGLALVRRVAEAHGGDVRFETEIGRGTTFELSIPRYRALAEAS